MYYVYKITNLINGKFYVGKRKHKIPEKDNYMGSGKLIKAAIAKYGKDNFTKDIIEIFETNEEAAILEKQIVTLEMVSSKQSYNMHEGGHGGFAHINKLPIDERVNVIAYREKLKNGSMTVGGRTAGSFKKGDKRTKELSNLANIAKQKYMKEDPERYLAMRDKMSKHQINNSLTRGTHCYIDSLYVGETPSMSELLKNRYFPGNEPIGYITIKEWKDSKKSKSGCYGKFWIHNTVLKQNKLTSAHIPEGWVKGRKQEYNKIR